VKRPAMCRPPRGWARSTAPAVAELVRPLRIDAFSGRRADFGFHRAFARKRLVFDWAGRKSARRVGKPGACRTSSHGSGAQRSGPPSRAAARIFPALVGVCTACRRIRLQGASAARRGCSALHPPVPPRRARARWILKSAGTPRTISASYGAWSGTLAGPTWCAWCFDRSFRRRRMGLRWVIDYKTSQHAGGQPSTHFLDREVER